MIATPAPARAKPQATDDWFTSSAIRCAAPADRKASFTSTPRGRLLLNEMSGWDAKCDGVMLERAANGFSGCTTQTSSAAHSSLSRASELANGDKASPKSTYSRTTWFTTL